MDFFCCDEYYSQLAGVTHRVSELIERLQQLHDRSCSETLGNKYCVIFIKLKQQFDIKIISLFLYTLLK